MTESYGSRKHQTVSLPKDLLDEVKNLVKQGELKGYRNHTEFIIEAVRMRVQNIKNPPSDEAVKKLVDIFKDMRDR